PPTPLHPLSLHDALPIFSLYMPLAPLEFAYCLIPREIICNASSRLCLLRTSHASLRCPRCLKSPDESVYSWNALRNSGSFIGVRSEEHTSELQSRFDLVC